MTHDLSGLADTLLNNFVTVRYPRSVLPAEWRESSDSDLMEYARVSERLVLRFEQMSLRMGLGDAGYCRFFELIECDQAGWRLHLFVADTAAVPLISRLVEGIVEPGQPLDFDPKTFIAERLRRLEKDDRLTGKYPWWIEVSP